MSINPKPIVLFVDDETAVLDGFKLTQSKRYDVRVALSGQAALDTVQKVPGIAVIVSDMRMPGMDGAALLGTIKEIVPDATRILLTGFAEVDSAAKAVNEGRIFRFLTKPCDAKVLSDTLAAAVEQHRLITSERILLQRTLIGSLKAVVGVLGLANPMAMGRAVRIRDRSRQLASKLGAEMPWDIEFAALFSQLSAATLPEDLVAKLYEGRELTKQDQAELTDSMRGVIEILKEIPRLEPVTKILEELMTMTLEGAPCEETAGRPTADARMLRCIIDLEALESRGLSARQASQELSKRAAIYGPNNLAALQEVVLQSEERDVAFCPLNAIEEGMVLAEDLRTSEGLLLLPRGFEITRSSKDHMIRRFEGRLPERIKVHFNSSRDLGRTGSG